MASVELSDDGRYVIARMRGNLSGRTARESVADIVALVERVPVNQYCGTLIDVRGARNIGAFESDYLFAVKDLADARPLVRNLRVALLTDATDRSHGFVASAAARLGWIIRFFVLESDAVEWLEHGDESAD